MVILNNLKDFYLYNNKPIAGIDPNHKNHKKGTAILSLSTDIKDTINFYENCLYRANYKGFYVPAKFITLKLKKTNRLNQKEIYADVKQQAPGITRFKKTIDLYKDDNVIYDLSYESKLIMGESKLSGLRNAKFYLSFIESRISNITNHPNIVLAVKVPENLKFSELTVNNTSTPFSILFTAFTKNILPESLKKVNFIFYTASGRYIKIKYSTSYKKGDYTNAFTKLMKAAKVKEEPITNTNAIDEPKNIPQEEDEKAIENLVNSEQTREETIKEIQVIYHKKLGVESKDKIGKDLQKQVNELDRLITNRIDELDINMSTATGEDIVKVLATNKDIVKQSKVVSDLALKGKANRLFVNKLEEQQDEVIFDGEKLKDILAKAENLKIDHEKIESDNIVNKEITENSIKDFDTSYSKKQMKKDLVNILTSFNKDNDIKLFVKDIKAENTSDLFTKKVTYTIKFLDDKHQQHTFKINYPILKDDKFIIVNGGRKLLLKQLLLLPLVKTKNDTVQITTNYNKMFITRFGEKLSEGTECIKKFLSGNIMDYVQNQTRFNYHLGKCNSKGYKVSLEYEELGKHFSFIENNKAVIYFDPNQLRKEIESKGIDFDYANEDLCPCMYLKDTKEIVLMSENNTNTYIIKDNKPVKLTDTLVDLIIAKLLEPSVDTEKMREFYSITPPKTLTYSRAKVTGRVVPIVILLGYEIGLKDILTRYKIDYKFIKTDKPIKREFGVKRVQFQDGVLTYSSMDLRATMLLEGLSLIDTESWNFDDMNEKAPYIEYFGDYHGSRNIGKGIHNMLSLMIDPITEEILESLDLPTNIYDLILEANTLLCSTHTNALNDMSVYRLRGAEQVNALLYKLLADSFRTYKDTSNNGNPIKISTDPDALFKALNALKTVDEYSVLNPSLEIDKATAVTYRGPSGTNMDKN